MTPGWRRVWRRYSFYMGLGLAIALLSTLMPWRLPALSLTSPVAPSVVQSGVWDDPVASGVANLSSVPPSLSQRSPQSPNILLREGQRLYSSGQLVQAIAQWQQVVSFAEENFAEENPEASGGSGTWTHHVTALNYLSIAYQDLGQWSEAEEAIATALSTLEAHRNTQAYSSPQQLADVLSTQGRLQLHQGRSEAALQSWKQAAGYYASVDAVDGVVHSQINQAQALRSLGYYRQSRDVLKAAVETVSNGVDAGSIDMGLRVKSLHSLGITLRSIGELEASQHVLEQAIALVSPSAQLTDAAPWNDEREALNLSLARTLQEQGQEDDALTLYQDISRRTGSPRLQIEANLKSLALFNRSEPLTGEPAVYQTVIAQPVTAQTVNELTDTIWDQLRDLPPSRWTIYAHIHLAEQMMFLGDRGQAVSQAIAPESPSGLIVLAQAIRQARTIEDKRAESYGLGQLGHVYEQVGQVADSLSLTQEAIALANDIQADNLAAFWYWQEGRLLTQLDRKAEAIESYSSAVQRLDALGQDLVAVSSDIQFSYRDQVEPIYRQLVQLLLEDVDAKPEAERQQRLGRSRDVIEALQVAELQNYFRAACQTADLQPIERIDPKATVIYPILLADRLEVIVSTPGQALHHYGHPLPEVEAQALFQSISAALNLTSRPTDILVPAQRLYDLLLRPGEAFFQDSDTLVFVLDGFLRNVPMAVLHDGQQFLVESYQLALTPGLQLLPAQALTSESLRVLTGGISEARQGFSALPGVQAEVTQVASSVRSTNVLLNQQFTEDRVRSQLQATPVSMVHLATHGQFSSKAAETFLLTWNDRLTIDDIEDLLTQQPTPVELLILSACETATGDNRATLGMAGIAVRSGARSTLATLWPVQDDSTALMMTTFYQQFLSQEHRAEALQKAQQTLLYSESYRHPFYWAPYVLVGNWQ